MAEAQAISQLKEQIEKLQLQMNFKKTPVATSSGGLPESKHLDGQNYADWSYWMKNFLIDAGLWCCIEARKESEIDVDLDQRALAKINLSVKSIASAETRKAKTAKEAWDMLQNTYEDKGVVRRIGLYSSLFRTKYEDFGSMSAFIDHISSIADQLRNIGKPLDDETVGGIILGGLPEKFRPLILGIQGSNQATTLEFVKNLLLQENVKDLCNSSTRSPNNAFYGKFNNQRSSQKQKPKKIHKPRCYNCNEFGHYSSGCPKESKREVKSKSEQKSKSSFFSSNSISNTVSENDWYLDSGCNAHMTPKRELLTNLKQETSRQIDVANGNIVPASGIGNAKILLSTGITADVNNVILAPALTANLLSISQIVEKGKSITFDAQGCRIAEHKVRIPQKSVIATATVNNGLYKLDTKPIKASVAVLNSHDIWHRRLAHLNRRDMKLLCDKMSTGMDPEPDPKLPCISCVKGKHHRTPFPKASKRRARNILELVHSDLAGPMQTPSIGGSKYFLTFTDDFSRKSFVYFLKNKSEVKSLFIEFKALVENQTGRTIKILRTDNGGEYVNNDLLHVLKSAGIRHQTTVPRNPEQNGVAERLNRTLVEKARSMLIDSGLSKDFWAEAVYTANYLKNRSPTKAVTDMTPEEAWSGKKPDLSHLRTFGCKALVHIPDTRRKKWDPKSEELIFVGYCENTKGYRVINPITKSVTISRDVIFIENDTTGKRDEITEFPPESGFEEVGTTNVKEVSNLTTPTSTELDEDEISDEIVNDSSDGDRRSKRIPIPNKAIFNEDFIVYQANLCCSDDPKTLQEAMSRPDALKWKAALEEEVQAHQLNETWEICDLPPGKKPIKSRWTFKIKQKADGTIDKYKVRLVAKGCSQKQGIDYEETFSPTVRHSSIRYLISLATKHNLDLDQMDVVTAFLHPDLNEEIYMELPENCEHFPQRICRLKKSIYGLKQANRIWYLKLDESLRQIGLQRSRSDPCIFFKINDHITLIVAVYVDDLLILSNDENEKVRLKEELRARFKMKDLGAAHHILGIRITRDRQKGTTTLDQSTYIKNVLKRFNMENCREAKTPSPQDQILTKDMSPKSEEEILRMEGIPYREAVGSLLYASLGTRPDICHAVGVVSRFSNNPGEAHWTAVKRILRYLKGTISRGLHFHEHGMDLTGYSDSDWANDRDDRHSTTGYIFCDSGGPISWNSKKQQTVALSTTEAEYMAISAATQELTWLRQLREELTSDKSPITLFCDNMSAINTSSNPVLSQRAKHIDIRHHFIREKITDGILHLEYIESENNVADALTKPLSRDKLDKFTKVIGLI